MTLALALIAVLSLALNLKLYHGREVARQAAEDNAEMADAWKDDYRDAFAEAQEEADRADALESRIEGLEEDLADARSDLDDAREEVEKAQEDAEEYREQSEDVANAFRVAADYLRDILPGAIAAGQAFDAEEVDEIRGFAHALAPVAKALTPETPVPFH